MFELGLQTQSKRSKRRMTIVLHVQLQSQLSYFYWLDTLSTRDGHTEEFLISYAVTFLLSNQLENLLINEISGIVLQFYSVQWRFWRMIRALPISLSWRISRGLGSSHKPFQRTEDEEGFWRQEGEGTPSHHSRCHRSGNLISFRFLFRIFILWLWRSFLVCLVDWFITELQVGSSY